MSRNPDFDAVMIKKTELDKLRADNERLRALLFRLQTSDHPRAAMLELIDAALADHHATSDMEYPKPDAPPDVWIAWYRWKLEDMDRLLQGSYDDNARLRYENAGLRRLVEPRR